MSHSEPLETAADVSQRTAVGSGLRLPQSNRETVHVAVTPTSPLKKKRMNRDLIANRDLRGDVGRCSSPPGMRRGIRRKAVHGNDGGGGHVGNPSKVNMGSC